MAPSTLELAGRSVHLLCARLVDHTNLAGVDTGLVEPVDNGQPRCLLIGRTLSQVSSEGDVLMQVLNANLEPVKIHQGTRLGVFTPSHAICTVTEEGTSPETSLPESLNIDLDSSNLSGSQIQELKRYLVSFHFTYICVTCGVQCCFDQLLPSFSTGRLEFNGHSCLKCPSFPHR